ncbi:MAG: glycosyl hydrolase 53 family protein [Alistipes sp.]|nr:glycosyl hydrolase 53 family protein [Alistipes sp.]
MKRLLLLVVPVLLAVACGGDEDVRIPNDPNKEQPTPEPVPEVEVFYKGTTMSFANYLIDFGLVYRENGEVTNPYRSVKNHGANIVRLQLDRQAFSEINGVVIDWQQWDRVVEDAKMAKAEGLDIMLTLKPDYDKYSSTGAQHNNIPEDWKLLDEKTLGGELHDWVFDTLMALHNEGIDPVIVAVGNEVNLGFLYNGSYDAARTARLLNYGYTAVRKYQQECGVEVLLALHIANPSQIGYVDTYKQNGCTNYDIIALSWYPGANIGHTMGSYRSFEALGKDMIKKHGKPIMVLETAYSFTTGSVNGKWMGDWCDNSYNYPDWNDATNATNYTPKKQREWLLALAQDVKAGGGIGLITWGTESLPDLLEGKAQGHGLGLYTYPAAWGYGSTWENNSYWDFTNENNLHEGIDWMSDLL